MTFVGCSSSIFRDNKIHTSNLWLQSDQFGLGLSSFMEASNTRFDYFEFSSWPIHDRLQLKMTYVGNHADIVLWILWLKLDGLIEVYIRNFEKFNPLSPVQIIKLLQTERSKTGLSEIASTGAARQKTEVWEKTYKIPLFVRQIRLGAGNSRFSWTKKNPSTS